MAFVFYNPNPENKRTGDCSVRALCKALDQDWETSFLGMVVFAMKDYDMPSANHVWGEYLIEKGFLRFVIPSVCPYCMSVGEFAQKFPRGTYVLACDNDHVVTLVDGDWYDTWDSVDSVVLYFYQKQEE